MTSTPTDTVTAVHGSALARTLQGYNLDGSIPTEFLLTDTLTATVWRVPRTTPIYTLAPTWADATTCKVQVALTGTQTDALSPDLVYNLQVFATRSGITYCTHWVYLRILPAAG
jgi:hypothetical protein